MKTEVICLYEICVDGSTQWEMVNPEKSECIEYFPSKEDAQAFADANGYKIVEWELGIKV